MPNDTGNRLSSLANGLGSQRSITTDGRGSITANDAALGLGDKVGLNGANAIASGNERERAAYRSLTPAQAMRNPDTIMRYAR